MHELEQAWKRLDLHLASQQAMLERLHRSGAIAKVRARLRLVTAGQLAQLATGLAIALWGGAYWFDHLGSTHRVVYGAALQAYGLALLIVAVLQLAHLARLDYRGAVLDVQRELIALMRLRARSERTLLILGLVAWVPFVFVILDAIGVDTWQLRPAVVLWNLAAAVALAAIATWLAHRFRDRFHRDAAGRSLRLAEAELAEVSTSC